MNESIQACIPSHDVGSTAVSLWDDPTFKRSLEQMDPEMKEKFKTVGEYLYQRDYTQLDPQAASEAVAKANSSIATQVAILLRDGLDPDDLTDEESRLYVTKYGLNSLKKYRKDVDTKKDGTLRSTEK